MDYAIKVENLGKRYVIGHDRGAGRRAYRYYSLRESLYSRARGLYQRLRHPLSPNRETTELEDFWALKDVNFEIKPGERVGIIGRNGAGKSTLLKLLSRITEPTTGSIDLNGRVASLLEVGTGFHPELTGRENIFLNGAILGMTRAEIKRKFDEIVAFAEVEKFLDTPVKHYSSGMYVRLAFAVAAHLEPEILLVDEVLAVGDAQFQKKCLGKMEDVSKEGRTVLFVSHNMAAIQQLCKKIIWLDNGQLKRTAGIEVIGDYIGGPYRTMSSYSFSRNEGSVSGIITILNVAVHNDVGSKITTNDELTLEIEYEIISTQNSIQIGFWLLSETGTLIFVAGDRENETWRDKARTPGIYCSKAIIPSHLLNEGTYYITLAADAPLGNTIFLRENIIRFRVELVNPPPHSQHGNWCPPGILCLSLDWNIEKTR